jgi:hypothetical protein
MESGRSGPVYTAYLDGSIPKSPPRWQPHLERRVCLRARLRLWLRRVSRLLIYSVHRKQWDPCWSHRIRQITHLLLIINLRSRLDPMRLEKLLDILDLEIQILPPRRLSHPNCPSFHIRTIFPRMAWGLTADGTGKPSAVITLQRWMRDGNCTQDMLTIRTHGGTV